MFSLAALASALDTGTIDALVRRRSRLRATRLFSEADFLKFRLEVAGVKLQDEVGGGTSWRTVALRPLAPREAPSVLELAERAELVRLAIRRIAESGRALALGVVDAPRTPQASAAAPRAPQTSEVRRTAHGRSNVAEVRRTLDAANYPANWSAAERGDAAAWDALPLAAKRRRMDEVYRDILRKCEEASQRKAAKRAAKVAARVEAVPPMPRKLRPKPRARQGNSHFVGPGKFYADWNEFDADLDKWEAERAARKELMAERHEAQQRVFRAKHPRLVSR